MKRYRVHVMQTVLEETWITVEAESAEEAMRIAPERAIDEDAVFSFADITGDMEGIQATELPAGAS